jgi:hypothetical protein
MPPITMGAWKRLPAEVGVDDGAIGAYSGAVAGRILILERIFFAP